MSMLRRVGAVTLGLLLYGGCNKKAEPPPPAVGLPPLTETAGAPVPGDHPVHEPMAAGQDPHGALPPGHPAVGGAAAPAAGGMTGPNGEQATPADIPFDAKTVLSGVLKVDPKLKSKVQAGDTLFLMVRRWDGTAPIGPPLAVKKLTVGTWPQSFALDSRDAMLAGTQFTGKVVVMARVDKDGDAMTKNPGDLVGQTAGVEPPQTKLVLNLDKTL
jgi:hypothetical protein